MRTGPKRINAMIDSPDDNFNIQIDLNKDALKLLLKAVDYRIVKWPGGEPREQTDLQFLQTRLRAAFLEYQFKD